MAYCRLRSQSPLRHVGDDFADSHLSQSLGTEGLSARTLTGFMKSVGKNRQGILAFMRSYAGSGGNVIFDGTDLLSASARMDFPRMSKTKLGGFAEAVNLMLAFSTGKALPVYYRLLPGNVRDVTSFLASVDEFGDRDMTVIGDKGFYSRRNVEELDLRGLRFVIALRRNTAGLDYDRLYRHAAEGHFFYAERLIKYTSQTLEGHTVYLYHDAKHAAEEEADYLRRVDGGKYENYTTETYSSKVPQFGTLAVMVSAGMNAKEAYDTYKTRCEVEQEIDVLKTDLDALTSYMQDNDRLEAWMFVNFIALHIFYAIRRRIVEQGLASKLSTREAIRILCRQRIVRLDKEWKLAEASAKDRALLEALGVPVT